MLCQFYITGDKQVCRNCGRTIRTMVKVEAECHMERPFSQDVESRGSLYRIPHQHELYQGKFMCRCVKCGWLSHFVSDIGELEHTCTNPRSVLVPPLKSPGVITKGINFIRAYHHHLATGSRECSFEEILERYKICTRCPTNQYLDAANECAACGCVINLLLAHEGHNKLSWQDSKCSSGHWDEIRR